MGLLAASNTIGSQRVNALHRGDSRVLCISSSRLAHKARPVRLLYFGKDVGFVGPFEANWFRNLVQIRALSP